MDMHETCRPFFRLVQRLYDASPRTSDDHLTPSMPLRRRCERRGDIISQLHFLGLGGRPSALDPQQRSAVTLS
jgi:hypothetical protein